MARGKVKSVMIKLVSLAGKGEERISFFLCCDVSFAVTSNSTLLWYRWMNEWLVLTLFSFAFSFGMTSKGTGFSYTTTRNIQYPRKIQLRKYDPIVNQHVLFKVRSFRHHYPQHPKFQNIHPNILIFVSRFWSHSTNHFCVLKKKKKGREKLVEQRSDRMSLSSMFVIFKHIILYKNYYNPFIKIWHCFFFYLKKKKQQQQQQTT